MRTTITIDDGVFSELARYASERNSTISRLIEEAVRRLIHGKALKTENEEPFKLVTFGRGGRFSAYNIDKTSALLESDDVEKFGRSGR